MDPLTMSMLAKFAIGQGFGGLASNLFGDPGEAYRQGQQAYAPWIKQASDVYNPFYQGGVSAGGKYAAGLDKMSDPSKYLNDLMGNYRESDYAKYLQDQVGKAGINAASASGLVGSTPYLQQAQQNAAGIASKDMQQWLANALGINRDYLTGQSDIYGKGLQAAGGMSNVFTQRAQDEAKMAYGREAADQSRQGGLLGSLGNIIGGLFNL